MECFLFTRFFWSVLIWSVPNFPLFFEHFNKLHCVKSVGIRSYSGAYFPAFGLNTDQNNSEYGHFSRSAKVKKRVVLLITFGLEKFFRSSSQAENVSNPLKMDKKVLTAARENKFYRHCKRLLLVKCFPDFSSLSFT